MRHVLVAASRPGCMRVDFHMACINHQPLKVRFRYQFLQQYLPNTLVTPAAETTMRVFPVSIVRRQVAPGGASAQNPENRIDKSAVVASVAAPSAFAPQQMGFQNFPNSIRYVVPPMCLIHAGPPMNKRMLHDLIQIVNLLTTLSRTYLIYQLWLQNRSLGHRLR